MKKFLLTVLCALMTLCCMVAASACGVSITPNDQGGINITPSTGNSGSGDSSSSASINNSSENNESSSDSENKDSSSSESTSSSEQECSHTWDGGIVVINATCEAVGEKEFTCILCGDKRTQEIDVLEHSYGAWTLVRESTCAVEGEEKRVCANDPTHVETRPIAKTDEHTYGAWAVVSAATCESKGEEKRVCANDATHVETRETPALGHSYSEWTESVKATCTEKGEEKRVCANDATHMETRETPALGHSYGEWTESKKATCESKGEEKRVCAHDATHVETRETPALGHKYGEWVEVSASTCAKEGVEERVCANDSTHKETRALPKTDEHSVNLETGKCTVCKNTVRERLETVATADIRTTDKGITWASVDCAEFYQVKISYGLEVKTVDVYSTALDLTPYFAGNKYLYLQFRAMATLDGEYAHSVWTATYDYEITGESVATAIGIGNTIDLRTGEYTDYDANFESIFDVTLFNRLRIVKKTLNNLESTVSYGQDIRSYLESESRNINQKINQKASVNVGKIANANTSFDFKLGANYAAKSQSKTETVLFDMTSYYLAEELSILGSANIENLQGALSGTFKENLAMVDSGFMTEAEFVNLYGSHVIVSAIYGAKFNVSYNMLYTGESSEMNSDLTTEAGIKASVEAALSSSVNGGASSSTELASKYAWLKTNDLQNKQTSFTVSAIGGKNANFSSLESFANGYQDWIDSVNKNQDNGNLPLIDVSDGGLYCIWDLLASKYPTAKTKLDTYLYNTCKANGKAIENKINTTYYTDFIDFDEDEGVLTVNFEGLQRMDSNVDVSTLISYGYYDNATGVFTVTPQYPVRINGEEVGVDVQKVVFKGKYKEANTAGELFEHGFQGISIRFSSSWTRDIVVEFDSFAYEAKSGQVALDFSEAQSENITINVVGSSYIKGGDGVSAGANGMVGLNASGKTLSITGAGTLEIYGGNGVVGVKGKDGEQNCDGVDGGNGGNGGNAVCADALSISGAINAIFVGGSGAKGGDGGRGGDGIGSTQDSSRTDGKRGGNGGNGGDGGFGLVLLEVLTSEANATIKVQSGRGGDGGNGGNGGKGGWNDWWLAACNGASGGDGGDGGNGGNSFTKSFDYTCENINVIAGEVGTHGIRGFGGAKGDVASSPVNNPHNGYEGNDGKDGRTDVE